MRRFICTVTFLIFAFAAFAAASSVTFAQVPDRPTPEQLFAACGSACGDSGFVVSAISAKAGAVRRLSATSTTTEPIGVLVTPGTVVGSYIAPVALHVGPVGFPGPVWIAGRVKTFRSWPPNQVQERMFYAARNLDLTGEGPGYFLRLYPGAVIPIGEVQLGNAGERTEVTLVIYDSLNGGVPLSVLKADMWAFTRGTSQTDTIRVTSADVMPDGQTIQLTGKFPVGERLLVEVGNPGWMSAFTDQVKTDGSTAMLPIPRSKYGNQLHPASFQAEVHWGLNIVTQDGECFSFPGILPVVGRSDGGVTSTAQ